MENNKIKSLGNEEMVIISGGSEFTLWISKKIGEYFGSISRQKYPGTFEGTCKQFGDNYLLWP